MTARNPPRGYTAAQILLHWVIAVLVVFQLIFGEDIVPAYRAVRRGTEALPSDILRADVHIYVGFTILVLAMARLAIRLMLGAPPAPAGESAVQKWIAAATHFILYATIFLMPVTGALAWYLGIGAIGKMHELAKSVIIAAVVLHASGALWQHFVAKTDVLVRMLRPGAGRAT
ncbi:cytochrome b/b6 domain-containing protein [Bradyrhizobium sp. BRP22]|uniref:cytochrome b n=1 Tax=Bradyrhizobium sp. BRP22 TaxID=2793821 RepID=UPI001CD7FB26|nr:cytochrome b/b6 domain-containing protein [Bradyrhizobium sp. BRP22]MCA1456070.1 cytochrome b/b6 domain-containing protein [Bradyrhizobium sp. BRP22]